jgi:hypothetical protein
MIVPYGDLNGSGLECSSSTTWSLSCEQILWPLFFFPSLSFFPPVGHFDSLTIPWTKSVRSMMPFQRKTKIKRNKKKIWIHGFDKILSPVSFWWPSLHGNVITPYPNFITFISFHAYSFDWASKNIPAEKKCKLMSLSLCQFWYSVTGDEESFFISLSHKMYLVLFRYQEPARTQTGWRRVVGCRWDQEMPSRIRQGCEAEEEEEEK